MRLSLLSFLTFLYFSSSAQSDLPLFKTGTIALGITPGFLYGVQNSGWPDYKKYRSYGVLAVPYAGVFLHPSLHLGIKGEYIGRFSNYQDFPSVFGAGYYLRYHPVPKGLQQQLSLSRRSKKKMNFYFNPMVEVSHTIRNAGISRSEILPTQDRLFADEVVLGIGGVFRLGQNFFVSLQRTWAYNFEADQFFGWFPTTDVRFEFYFNRNDPKHKFRFWEKKRPEEMIAVLPQKDSTRTHTLGNLILGSSLTYIWYPDDASTGGNQPQLYEEYTWAINAAVDLSRSVRVGIDHKTLRTNNEIIGRQDYSMTGLFAQYDLLPRREARFFVSAMLYHGNYCTCDPADPYRQKNLFYYGFGVGTDVKLTHQLYLDLAWENMNIFNKLIGKYNYTQYIIGLDYYLWQKKPQP